MARWLYKLTDQNGNTFGDTHWEEGTKHSIEPELRDTSKPLCTKHYLHAYENPFVAVFRNPADANIKDPILWRASGWVSKRAGQLKCGCFSLITHEKLELPILTVEQRIAIAIYCALETYLEQEFVSWAKRWLSGEDRTADAADAAAYAAYTAAAAAADAADAYAAYTAADIAAGAADAAAYAAYAASAATYAADANAAYAAYTTYAVATAACAAYAASLDLIKIINKVLKTKNLSFCKENT
jgi:hypothetical protein